MAEISKITLPNGASYDIKDSTARQLIADLETAGVKFIIADELPTATKDTVNKIYLIPHSHEEGKDIYDEYVTIEKDSEYSWEKIGNTDINLTNYSKKTHTHTVTPNITITGASYTPQGDITNASFQGTQGDVSVSGTTDGTVGTPTISIKNTSGSTIDLYSMSSAGFYTESQYTPEEYTVSNETLIFTSSSYTKEQVTLPSRTQANITASAPTFTGKSITSTGKFTPSGNVSASFSGTSTTITPTLNNGKTTITTSVASE